MSAALAALIYSIRTAVDGYENETGFYPIEAGQEAGLPRLIMDEGLPRGLSEPAAIEPGKVASGDSAQPFPAAVERGRRSSDGHHSH